MVKYCAVATCRNSSRNRPDLTFFSFPVDHDRRNKWAVFCKRADKKFENLADPRICSFHFKETDVKTSISGRKFVVGCPTFFDPAGADKTNSARAKRCEDRQRVRLEQEPPAKKHCAKTLTFEDATDSTASTVVDVNKIYHDHAYFRNQEEAIDHYCMQSSDVCLEGKCSIACQTDLVGDEIDYLITEIEECRRKCMTLSEKIENRKKLKRELNTEDILQDDESVKFYTGLPNLACFHFTLKLIQPYTDKLKYWDKTKNVKSYYQGDETKRKPGRQRQLSVKEEYLLVLCRLRLGILNRQLGDMFGVSESTICKTVTTWVCLLAKLFNGTLLRWPSREEIKRQFPKSFKKYPNTRVVIDATELFIEKPTSPCAQRATWSDYKHHNTLKLLVGIAPNGAFTFISKLWSGSTSDRKIVQESGLIDLLKEGDHVMADRGFNIRDLLTRRGVKLNIPPFSKGKFTPC